MADDELPDEVVERAERLTRLAREAVDDAEADAYRAERAELLDERGFTARVREEDASETLVLHPAEWVESVAPEEQRGEGGDSEARSASDHSSGRRGGDTASNETAKPSRSPREEAAKARIRVERIEDTSRAVEISLSGPGDPDDWNDVDEHNRAVAARVREAHGDVHGDNAAAFADFMGNHYARPVESASREEVEEFLTEYFPRNAWPTENQRAVVGESVELLFEVAEE